MQVVQNAEHAPRKSRLPLCSAALLSSVVPWQRNTARLRPPSLGVSLALRLYVGVLRHDASKLAVSYTRAHKANHSAENIARAPPNKRSAVWGAARSVATSGGHVPRSARLATKLPLRITHCQIKSSLSRNANLEPKRKFPPYFKRSAEMGGRKRAFIPMLAHGGPKKAPWYTMAGAFWGGLSHAAPENIRSNRST